MLHIARRSDNPKWAQKKLFTTGEAAEICKVSQQTIIRAFDSGKLRGFRVPGSRFRRILRDELLRYMKASGISTDLLEGRTRRVLLVDTNARLNKAVRESLAAEGAFEVEAARTGFDAGVLTEQFRPHVVIVDDGLPDVDSGVVCDRVRAHPDLTDTKIIILKKRGGAGSNTANGEETGADRVLRKPVKAQELVRHVIELVRV